MRENVAWSENNVINLQYPVLYVRSNACLQFTDYSYGTSWKTHSPIDNENYPFTSVCDVEIFTFYNINKKI